MKIPTNLYLLRAKNKIKNIFPNCMKMSLLWKVIPTKADNVEDIERFFGHIVIDLVNNYSYRLVTYSNSYWCVNLKFHH